MKRKSLSTTHKSSINLMGIACIEKDYRVCYFINKVLNISLIKCNNQFNYVNKKEEVKVDYFYFIDINAEYYLISNLINKKMLLPKYTNINYWLIIRNKSETFDLKKIEESIHSLKIILGSFIINVEQDIQFFSDLIYS